jgi:hypothetical protein
MSERFLRVHYATGCTPQRLNSESIQNHENESVRNIGQDETPHREYKRLKFGGGQL